MAHVPTEEEEVPRQRIGRIDEPIFQVAGPAEGGWRVLSVWESREAQERFRDERLIPAFSELGLAV